MGHGAGDREFACGWVGEVHRFERLRRSLIRGSMGGLLLMLFAAHGVAAAGTPGSSPPPPVTQPTAPPTTFPPATQRAASPTTQPTVTDPAPPATAPPSGAAGQLNANPGTSSPTPPQTQATPPPTTSPSSPMPSGAAILMPLQPPTAEMPPATATVGASSPTAQAPTVPPTAPRPASTQTPIPTATSQPTSTPTGTPTGTPAGTPTGTPIVTPSPEEVAALANLVLLDDPGTGGNATILHAAALHFGELLRPDGVPWVGWCEMYIGNVMDEAGIPRTRYATALLDATSGPLYRGRAPAGSIVYFDQRSDPSGHAGIALGDGTMLSALGNGIVRSAYENWLSYLGWRPYGTTALPGETFVIAPLLTDTDSDLPRMPMWP